MFKQNNSSSDRTPNVISIYPRDIQPMEIQAKPETKLYTVGGQSKIISNNNSSTFYNGCNT